MQIVTAAVEGENRTAGVTVTTLAHFCSKIMCLLRGGCKIVAVKNFYPFRVGFFPFSFLTCPAVTCIHSVQRWSILKSWSCRMRCKSHITTANQGTFLFVFHVLFEYLFYRVVFEDPKYFWPCVSTSYNCAWHGYFVKGWSAKGRTNTLIYLLLL